MLISPLYTRGNGGSKRLQGCPISMWLVEPRNLVLSVVFFSLEQRFSSNFLDFCCKIICPWPPAKAFCFLTSRMVLILCLTPTKSSQGTAFERRFTSFLHLIMKPMINKEKKKLHWFSFWFAMLYFGISSQESRNHSRHFKQRKFNSGHWFKTCWQLYKQKEEVTGFAKLKGVEIQRLLMALCWTKPRSLDRCCCWGHHCWIHRRGSPQLRLQTLKQCHSAWSWESPPWVSLKSELFLIPVC